ADAGRATAAARGRAPGRVSRAGDERSAAASSPWLRAACDDGMDVPHSSKESTVDSQDIVVATDGSPHAEDAIRWAAREADRIGAALRIVTVQEPWGDPYGITPDLRAAYEEMLAEILKTGQEIATEAYPDIEVFTLKLTGDVVDILAEESARAHYLVTGSRGRGGFSGLVLGSTSMRLTARA